MGEHKLFSPSKSGMWIACPGSMSFPENQDPEGGSSSYADDGSATHHWGAMACRGERIRIGDTIEINGTIYTLDEERYARVAAYAEDVNRRAIAGYLHVERFVDLSQVLGDGQGGTPDIAIVVPHLARGIIEDLKDGQWRKSLCVYSRPASNGYNARNPRTELAASTLRIGLVADVGFVLPHRGNYACHLPTEAQRH